MDGSDLSTGGTRKHIPIRAALLMHAKDNQWGEFVVVGPGVELRFFLEHGRLAWASSSRSRHAFTNYLERFGVDQQVVLEAVRECQRRKLAIGELLVDWGVVTEDQVRDALEFQIKGAVEDLVALGNQAQALFVPRRVAEVGARRVTFDVDRLLAPIDPQQRPSTSEYAISKERIMSKYDLAPLSEIEGYMASALVDSTSGMVMGENGVSPFPLELAAAGNTRVLAAKRKTMQSLGIADKIEDLLISLGSQYHIIRPLEANDTIFLYVVLDRSKSNLAMARHVIRDFEKKTVL